MSIRSRIIKIIADRLNFEESEIKDEFSFVNDLGADSLDQAELIMAIEKEFDIFIPDEDAKEIQAVQDAIDYVKGKL